ncbi:protein distal antenna [Lutzomyia longipalpis]|uniref:protein distal antenna n=1 Tax=Lutzomyia longipalpis TaxID=7200 RepID=UPI0024841B38|nr:protein distal antenna [Lutzomyia longipalpis]XP_055678306.1 protein distal antenna [Lutzomyia longipalpis]
MMSTVPATSKGKRPLRHLTASDKIDAIQRIHDGESKASVARDIGVPESTLRGWCKNEEKLRYMSRQSTPDKPTADKMMDKLDAALVAAAAASELLNGPPEKRQKLDTSLPLNFSANGKLKYDDPYKRSSLNGLDLSDHKGLNGSELHLNGLGADYSTFAKTAADLSAMQGKSKDMSLKGYGADLSKPNDPSKADLSMAAISPLSNLTQFSSVGGLGTSPLALSFNDIAANLNILAQLQNPALAGMSGLGSLSSSSQSLRSARPKSSTAQSVRSDLEKNQGLTVKNLAKLQHKNSVSAANDLLSMGLDKGKYKMTSPSGLNRDAPMDDSLWYWLKSQQSMLGIGSLYSAMPQTSSPLRSTPPSQSMAANHTPTPPVTSSPQITPPSSTPSGASDDAKNQMWLWNWYKSMGASLMGNDKQYMQPQTSVSGSSPGMGQLPHSTNGMLNGGSKQQNLYNNILFSQLTKNEAIVTKTEPEDLSQHPPVSQSATTTATSGEEERLQAEETHITPLPLASDTSSTAKEDAEESGKISESPNPDANGGGATSSAAEGTPDEKSLTKVRAVLDDLLFHNNNNEIKSEGSAASSPECSVGYVEAVEHGEKFLQWLETCSDPNITAMQVMQFRYLLQSIRLSLNRSTREEPRVKIRRRK